MDEEVDLIFCQICTSYMYFNNWQQHYTKCTTQQSKKLQKKEEIKNVILPSVKITKIQTNIINQFQKKQEVEQKMYCTQCGQIVAVQQYKDHQQLCIEKQISKCTNCNISIPVYLIEQHNQVCRVKKIQNNNQQDSSSSDQQYQYYECQNYQENDYQDIYKQQQNLNNLISNLQLAQQNKEQGLCQKQIDKFLTFSLIKQEDCAICFKKMQKISKHIKLNCKHTFHQDCINPWLLAKPICPMCRQHASKK